MLAPFKGDTRNGSRILTTPTLNFRREVNHMFLCRDPAWNEVSIADHDQKKHLSCESAGTSRAATKNGLPVTVSLDHINQLPCKELRGWPTLVKQGFIWALNSSSYLKLFLHFRMCGILLTPLKEGWPFADCFKVRNSPFP